MAVTRIWDAATGQWLLVGGDTGDLLSAPYLPLAGGTLSGPLVLPGPPILSLQAATKGYVDSLLGTGGGGGGGDGIPPGVMLPYGGATPPPGYLFCDGAAVSRGTYSVLYGVLGNAFGAGDGTSTFNLPDLRQRFPMGVAASGVGATRGATGGSINHTHPGPSHSHTGPSHTHAGPSHVHEGPLHSHGKGTLFIGNTDGVHAHGFSDSFTTGGPSVTGFTGNPGGSSNVAGAGHVHSGSISGTTGATGAHGHGLSGVTSSGGANDTGAAGTGQTGPSGTGLTGLSGTGLTGTANPPFLACHFIIKT